MNNQLTDEKLLSSLEDLSVDGTILLNNIKTVYDNMYIIQNQECLNRLYRRVETILKVIPISYIDDCNHRIRSYCYFIFQQLLSKRVSDRSVNKEMLVLLISCILKENEVNATTVIKTIEYLLSIADPIPSDVVDSFLIFVEKVYSSFPQSVSRFLSTASSAISHSDSSQSCSSTQVDGSRSESSSSDLVSLYRQDRIDSCSGSPIPSVDGSILIMNRCLSITLSFLKKYATVAMNHKDTLLYSLTQMLNTRIFPLSDIVEEQYSIYAKVTSYSVFFSYMIFDFYQVVTAELRDKVASIIIQFIVYYPKHDYSLRDSLVTILIKIYRKSLSQVYLRSLPMFLVGGLLFEDNPLLSPMLFEQGILLVAEIAVTHVTKLSLLDIQCITLRFCGFIENPQASFRVIRKLIDSITRLKPAFSRLTRDHMQTILVLLYRILITYVRKIEDLRQIVIYNSRVYDIKGKYQEYEYTNQRYTSFVNGNPVKPPLPEYDSHGIRVIANSRETKIGDIVVKENRVNTLVLLQQFCKGIVEIIMFFHNPVMDSSEGNNTNRSIPFTEPFIHLIYRYLVGILGCTDLLKVDDSHFKDQVIQCIRYYSDVFAELPQPVKRKLLAITLPHIYKTTVSNPLLLDFVANIFASAQQPTVFVLIDFVANHLDELEKDTNKPPIILSFFKIGCKQLSVCANDEALFKPYLKRIICECFRRMINTSDWTPFLDFLYQLVSFVNSSKSPDLHREMATHLMQIIPQLRHMEQVCGDSHTLERIIEIVIHLPLSLSGTSYMASISSFMPFYIKGLYGPDSLQKSALTFFDTFFQKLPTENMLTLLSEEPLKSEFMAALNTIVHNSSNQSIVAQALALFGHLGGKTRSSMRPHIDLPCIESDPSGYMVSLHCPNQEEYPICCDRFLEEAVGLIYRNLIVEPIEGTEIKLGSTLHCNPKSIVMIRSQRAFYKKISLRIIESCLIACCNTSDFVSNLDLNSLNCLLETKEYDVSQLFPKQDNQDRVICLLLYGLLLACCDVEVGEVAKEMARRVISFMVSLFINYTYKVDDSSHSFSFKSISEFQSSSFQSTYGVCPCKCPLHVVIPQHTLSPRLLFAVLAALLDCEIPTVSSKIIEISQIVLSVIEEYTEQNPEDYCLMVPLIEMFMAVLLKHGLDGGWRCKENICDLFLFWCERLPDFLVSRISSQLIRYVFSFVAEIPPEFVVHALKTARRLLCIMLVKGFHITMDTSIKHIPFQLPQTNEWITFKEKEDAKYQSRIDDAAGVIITGLLTFYGAAHQVARQLMEDLTVVNDAGDLVNALKVELNRRPELEEVGRFPPQIQMSVFSAVEMGLRLHIFDATEERVKHILLIATKPFDMQDINDKMIKSITTYDFPTDYTVPIGGGDFHFSVLLKMDIYLAVLKLIQVFLLQRKELYDQSKIEDYRVGNELNSAIYSCVCLGFNCASETVTNILKPILPLIPSLNTNNLNSDCFSATKCIEWIIRLRNVIPTGTNVSTVELHRAFIVYPLFSLEDQKKIFMVCKETLQKLHDFFYDNKGIIKESIMTVVCQLFDIMSISSLTSDDFRVVIPLYSSFISTFNQYCPFFANDLALIRRLVITCNNNATSFIYYLLSKSEDTYPILSQPFIITTFIHMFSFSYSNNVSLAMCKQWQQFENLARKYFDDYNTPRSIQVLNSVYVELMYCVKSEDRVTHSGIRDFLSRSWTKLIEILDRRSCDLNTHKENAIRNIQNNQSSFHPLTYDDDNHEIIEIVVKLLIESLLHSFDASLSNSLAITFAYPLLMSMDALKNYYEIELPKRLTAEQRGAVMLDLMAVLRNDSISDLKKCCVLTYSIIPLLSSTFHNPSISIESAVPDMFLDDYAGSFIPSLQVKNSTMSSQLFVMLLQLNILLMENNPKRVAIYRSNLLSFATELYKHSDDAVRAWSLYYQAQYIRSAEYNGKQTALLFVTALKFYDTKYSDVVYKATALLSDSLLNLDDRYKLQVSSAVRKDMVIHEDNGNQQTHILRLIIQNPSFFYPFRDVFCGYMLGKIRHIGVRNLEATGNRELVINVLSLITSYYVRQRKERKNSPNVTTEHTQETVMRLFNTQLLNTCCRLLLISSMYFGDQVNCRRCFILLKDILTLVPRAPILLDVIDNLSGLSNETLLNTTEDLSKESEYSLYSKAMPLIATFRLSMYAIPYYQDFVELNAQNLSRKITRLSQFLSYDFVFSSFIEFFPVLFSVPHPYTSGVHRLFETIKGILVKLVDSNLKLISPENPKITTCMWRVLYLVYVIVEKNPSVIDFFIREILSFCDSLFKKYNEFFANPSAFRMLFIHNQEPPKSTLELKHLELPPIPVMKETELVYSLLLLIRLVATHMAYISADYRSYFINFLCEFFKITQRAELLTTVITLVRQWIEGDDDIVNLHDLEEILSKTCILRSLNESVLFVGIITEYWNLIYAVIVRYYHEIERSEYKWLKQFISSAIVGGMTLSFPDIHSKFRSLYFSTLPSSLFGRLQSLFCNVPSLIGISYSSGGRSSFFGDKHQWLPFFVEVLLTSDEWNSSIRLAKEMKRFPVLQLKHLENSELKPNVKLVKGLMRQSSIQSLDSLKKDLIELAYADMRLAYSLWVSFFPASWRLFTHQQRHDLTGYLSEFLACDMHFGQKGLSTHLQWEELDRDYKQWGTPQSLPFCSQSTSRYGSIPISNGIQALLESVLRCEPRPRLSTSLLLFLAENYGCGPIVSLLLEKDVEECVSQKEQSLYEDSLKRVYVNLNEKDAYMSLLRSVKQTNVHNGLVLEGFNQFQVAQMAYTESLKSEVVMNNLSLLQTVQERWKSCTENLYQWTSLYEYGRIFEDSMTTINCLSKMNSLKRVAEPFSLRLFQNDRDLSGFSSGLIADRSLALQMIGDKSLIQKTRLHETVISHFKTLVYQPIDELDTVFNQIALVYDLQLCYHLITHYQTMTDSNVAAYLKRWDPIVMNDWDPLSVWEDFYVWRANVCKELMAVANREVASPRISPSYHYLTLARVARKQGLYTVSLEYLKNDVFESNNWFERIVEASSNALAMNIGDSSVFDNLNKITNDVLSESQQSDISLVRGKIALRKGSIEEAVSYFGRAQQFNRKNLEVLECMASLLFKRWRETNEVDSAQRCLQYSIQQLALSSEIAKAMTRVLTIAYNYCDVIGVSIKNNFEYIPSFVWYSYLPVLFSKPKAAIFEIFHGVINVLIKKNVNAVFYPLMTLCQSLGYPSHSLYSKPTALLSGTITPSISVTPPSPKDQTITLDVVSSCYKSLLSIPNKVISQLLIFVDTLHSIPHDCYRELIGSIDTILKVIYSEIASKGPVALQSPVSQNLRQLLLQLCSFSFNPDNMVPSTHAFILQYGASFTQDFSETIMINNQFQSNPNFPSTIQELYQRLLLWKNHMIESIQGNVTNNLVSELFDFSRVMPNCVEIPGQCYGCSSSFHQYRLIQSMKHHTPSLYTEPHQWRFVDLKDEYSQTSRFYLEEVAELDQFIEERILFFQLYFNKYLDTSDVTQIRHIHPSVPCYVSISPNLRLVQFNPHSVILEGVYQKELEGRFDEEQLNYSVKQFFLNHPSSSVPSEYQQWRATITPENALNSVVSSSTLTKFIFSHMISSSDFYAFRSEFVREYGYAQFIQRLFASPNGNPDRMAFSLKTGSVMGLNLHPDYILSNGSFVPADRTRVPLRLTQNIQEFFSSYYETAFEFAFESIALTFKRNDSFISLYLSILENENLRLLHQRDPLKEVVKQNVDCIRTRGLQMAPNVDIHSLEKSEVDQMMYNAVKNSIDPVNLIATSPSFCAWF